MPRYSSFSSSLYNKPTGKSFTLIMTLDNPNPRGIANSDAFGTSVAVGPNHIAVGAPGEDGVQNTPSQGAVYVYDKQGFYRFTVENRNLLPPLNAGDGDRFGTSVALNSRHLLVGAPGENQVVGSSTVDNNGMIYIYSVDDATPGTLLMNYGSPNPATTAVTANGDAFGQTVALSENYMSASAYREDAVGLGDDTGYTYIYDIAGVNITGWPLSETHSIENPNLDTEDEYPGDQIGEKINTLAITDTYTMIGNWRENEPGALGQGDSGAFFLFNNSTGATDQSIYNPKDDAVDADDRFGYAVDLNENFAAVGCPGEDTDGTNSGRVYVYNPSTGNLVTTISNPNNYIGNNNDRFGESIAINDNYLAVGALDEDDDDGFSSGVVYIFNTSDWTLVTTLTNPNKYSTSTNDKFGYTIRMDDEVLVVGVPAEEAGSGAVYIYKV
jgi:hypothetical protein